MIKMKNIVTIEDNEDHALLIRRSTQDSETLVSHFSDGEAALKELKGSTKADLIFLDLKMPGIDGFKMLEYLRKIDDYHAVPIVILTTSSRNEEVKRAYEAGASGFVVKSDDFDEFVAKLKQVKEYWFHTVVLPKKD